MKITAIDTFMSWVDWCNWLLVRISTDEGVCGWGEASLHGAVESVDTAVREYGAQLIGQFLRRIGACYRADRLDGQCRQPHCAKLKPHAAMTDGDFGGRKG